MKKIPSMTRSEAISWLETHMEMLRAQQRRIGAARAVETVITTIQEEMKHGDWR